jgi:6-phosphogluconolactonase (cycloisomerase 2 family)
MYRSARPCLCRSETSPRRRRTQSRRSPPGGQLGQGYHGIDFLDSHCNCLPPDTNAAVGKDFVVETVNTQIRFFDKTTGAPVIGETLGTFFGAPSGGDPYMLYDDLADRWYVSAFDSSGEGLFLAVSSDGNPLDGFHTYHIEHLGFPDYQKPGFNKDAIFISYNDFGPGGGAAATILSIDKAAALSGSLMFFKSVPKFQFRAMPPAQMHGGTTGGVEWFVSTDGTDASGTTMRVTRMTDYLTNHPLFTYTSLPAETYKNAPRADQPGGSVTTFPNTTTTQVQYHNGHLVTAMASSIGRDGYVYPKGLFFQIDIHGTPTLIKRGVIDPGVGVAVQMPSVDEDQSGNLGFTWMESSTTEFLSMWVGTLDTNGTLSASVAAPGGGLFPINFRIGDYSTTVLDPSDHKTFFSANEYIGPDGSTDIWRTHIRSFTAMPAGPEFVYVANLNSGNVSGYTIDATTGALTAISGSPFAAGSGAFSIAVDPTGKFAYVVNETSGNVSGYTIAPTTGALTAIGGSPFATGRGPAWVAVDPTGKFAYVANNLSFNVSGYRIDPTTGTLTAIGGSPFAAGLLPTSVAVDPTGKFAYVTNEMSSDVSGYTIDPTTGALTAISGSPFLSGGSGSRPFSIAVGPTGKFAYVANNSPGNVSAYTINPTTGALTPISGSPFPAGGAGSFSVAVDPTGKFAYVANIGGVIANVSGFTINPATGALTAFGGPTFLPGTGPVSVAVDPTGSFAYVANFNSNNVSAYTIDPTTGALTAISGSPFAAGASPRSVAVARPR